MLHRATAKVIAVLGVVLIVAGAASLTISALPVEASPSVAIPQGTALSSFQSWGLLTGGTMSGSYHVEDGGAVSMVVLNEVGFRGFSPQDPWATSHPNVYNETSSGTQFSIVLAGHDNFHLVFIRTSSDLNGPAHVIDENVTVSGIIPYPFGAGIVLLLGGGPAIIVGGLRVRGGKPPPAPTWRS